MQYKETLHFPNLVHNSSSKGSLYVGNLFWIFFFYFLFYLFHRCTVGKLFDRGNLKFSPIFVRQSLDDSRHVGVASLVDCKCCPTKAPNSSGSEAASQEGWRFRGMASALCSKTSLKFTRQEQYFPFSFFFFFFLIYGVLAIAGDPIVVLGPIVRLCLLPLKFCF